MVTPAMPPSQRVPNEILSLICDEISDLKALVSLCRTSRLFLVLAQPNLYRRVILDGERIRTVRKWCIAVAKHPHLAKRVYSLSASLPNLSVLEPNDAQKMMPALRACVNLKELQMTSCSPTPEPGSPWMLGYCSFQLTVFRGLYFSFDYAMMRFLASQRAIRVLDVPRWVDDPHSFQKASPSDTLPNLIAVSGPLNTLPRNYPLQRIQTMVTSASHLSPLTRYAGTLTTLNLFLPSSSTNAPTASDVIGEAASLLPTLIHLALVVAKAPQQTRLRLVGLAPSHELRRFANLATFTLFSRNFEFARGSSFSNTYPCDMEHGMRELAINTLNACGSLTRAVIGYEVSAEKEWMCTATRVPGGEPSTTLEDGMDFEAVSMLAV